MYSYCDQSALNVSRGDRLLLWASRAWAWSIERGDCPFRLLLPIFSRMGLITSTIHFHRSMCCLQLGGADLPPFTDAAGDQIDETEAVLLALWAKVRNGEQKTAIRTLEYLVQSDWVVPSLDCMSTTCRELLNLRADLFATPRRRPPIAADRATNRTASRYHRPG